MLSINSKRPHEFLNPIKKENILIIGDPHINLDLQYYDYEYVYSKLFEKAKALNKEYVIILGDIYDAVNKLSLRDLKAFINIIKNGLLDYKLKFIILTGNHDMISFNPEYNQKNLFELYGWELLWNTRIVLPTEVFKFENFYFIPYIYDEKTLEETLLKIKDDMQVSKILEKYNECFIISHNNFKELFSHINKNLLDMLPGIYFRKIFKDKRIKLISGHIHNTFIDYENKIYCAGNFLDTNFKDSNIYSSALVYSEVLNDFIKLASLYNVWHLNFNYENFNQFKQLLFLISLYKEVPKKLLINITKNNALPDIITILEEYLNETFAKKLNIISYKIQFKQEVISNNSLNTSLQDPKNELEILKMYTEKMHHELNEEIALDLADESYYNKRITEFLQEFLNSCKEEISENLLKDIYNILLKNDSFIEKVKSELIE